MGDHAGLLDPTSFRFWISPIPWLALWLITVAVMYVVFYERDRFIHPYLHTAREALLTLVCVVLEIVDPAKRSAPGVDQKALRNVIQLDERRSRSDEFTRTTG
jgi:hypothetical protein